MNIDQRAIAETRADLLTAMSILKTDLGYEPANVAEAMQMIEPALKIAMHIAHLRLAHAHMEKQR